MEVGNSVKLYEIGVGMFEVWWMVIGWVFNKMYKDV